MDKSKKIVQVISFKNEIKNGIITKHSITKMNEFLATIDADDFISYEIDRDRNETPIKVRLTYKKTVENKK